MRSASGCGARGQTAQGHVDHGRAMGREHIGDVQGGDGECGTLNRGRTVAAGSDAAGAGGAKSGVGPGVGPGVAGGRFVGATAAGLIVDGWSGGRVGCRTACGGMHHQMGWLVCR